MIHEIFPHRFSNIYLGNIKPGEHDLILHYKGNALLLKKTGDEISIPCKEDLPQITGKTETRFLFSLDDVHCFLVTEDLVVNKPDLAFSDISFFRDALKREVAWMAIAGYHLRNWYVQNRFCGSCGSMTIIKRDERAIICPDCNSVVYPKISPAVIVAITCGNRILLARNTNFPGRWYSLVAGYADIGESLEETVIREVKEEVGLDITNIRYYKSQPWPLSGSMMVGFVAEADDRQPVRIDEKEITGADWFTRGNLPEHPSGISIAGEMIEKFEKGEL